MNFLFVVDDVLFCVFGLVGMFYCWGGNMFDLGFDCSGLINFVYCDMIGIKLLCLICEMIFMCVFSVLVQVLQIGDLVFFVIFGGCIVSYVGIYVGEGCFVYVLCIGGMVCLDSLQNSYW